MKNKICAILLLTMLALPVFSMPEEESLSDIEAINTTDVAQEEIITQEQQEELLPAAPEETLPTTPFKQPVSKKKIIMKFMLAMLGVVGSSIIIYVGLSIYNRIREVVQSNVSYESEDNEQLASPHDFTDAVKSFLNNTKWD